MAKAEIDWHKPVLRARIRKATVVEKHDFLRIRVQESPLVVNLGTVFARHYQSKIVGKRVDVLIQQFTDGEALYWSAQVTKVYES